MMDEIAMIMQNCFTKLRSPFFRSERSKDSPLQTSEAALRLNSLKIGEILAIRKKKVFETRGRTCLTDLVLMQTKLAVVRPGPKSLTVVNTSDSW